METDYPRGLVGGAMATPCVPSAELLTTYPRFTRQRVVELTNIANKVLELAEQDGVKKEERCRFGEICQNLWRE